MEDSPFKEGDVIAGKYQVERVLGEGGMGVVVAARHLELEQRVAVKFLLPEIAKRADAAERFRREARAAVKIRSEHVARVLDVGTSDDGTYMVMEYLEGHDLGQELRTRGALDVEEAVAWVLEASEAVAEAHAAGIVHRDLKPANLFLAQRADGTRLVKVLDFGISKSVAGGSASDMSLTNTSALIGSPLYMSPEQMHSAKSVDTRTDIWALGAILYQVLARRPPYVGDTIPQLCHSLLNDTPPPLATFRADVPAELETVILRALEKDREKRFQSVAVLAAALAPFAPGARVHAERAARMLGVKDSGAALGDSSPQASEAVSGLGTEPTLDAETGARTEASWGKTGDPGSSQIGKGKGKRWLLAALAGSAVAAVVVAVGITRTRANAEPATAAAPSVAEAPTPPPPPVAPTTTPPEPEAPPSVSVEAPTPSAEPAPAKPKPAPAVAKPRPASKPKEKAKPTLSDFGGRR